MNDLKVSVYTECVAGQYNNTYNDLTYNDFTYNEILVTLNTGDITYNDITCN